MYVFFHLVCKRKTLTCVFPHLLLNGIALLFVTQFKYLEHIISNKFTDDDHIKRERRNTFMIANIPLRRYSECSLSIKLIVLKVTACAF